MLFSFSSFFAKAPFFMVSPRVFVLELSFLSLIILSPAEVDFQVGRSTNGYCVTHSLATHDLFHARPRRQFDGGGLGANFLCYRCPALSLYHLRLWEVPLSLLYSGMRWAGDIQGCLMSSSIWLPSALRPFVCCCAALNLECTYLGAGHVCHWCVLGRGAGA